MGESHSLPWKVRFGKFEIDTHSGEIRKNGRKTRLPDQPFRILLLLLERPNDVVTREELRLDLWPADTFVDFDHGLNNAVNRIRETLGDSAEDPRYIETLPRRGYRFIAPVETCHPNTQSSENREPLGTVPLDSGGDRGLAAAGIIQTPIVRAHLSRAVAIGGAVVAVLTVILAADVGGLHDRMAVVMRSRSGFPSPKIESIAVLPLENLTGDPALEYVVDGIHDELITQLAQVSSLKVISRTSVMRYKKEKPPLRRIGEELGVEVVLEGTVRREGGRLHVTAQLISVQDDRHVWARSYDRDMGEASALPGEVARAIAQKLYISLTSQERVLLGKAKPVDPAVYTAYLKGRYFKSKMTNENLHKAIDFFREAIDQDPGYAPAWAEMGASFDYLSGYALREKSLSEKDAVLNAEAALNNALELDPTLRKPHVVLGGMKLNRWDWDGAAREFEQARHADPGWRGASDFLVLSGTYDEAVDAARREAERNPLAYSSHLFLGWTYFAARRFDESIAALKKTVQLDPQNHNAHFELGWNYAKKSLLKEAVSECEISLELLRRTRPEAVTATECGWVYGLAGRRREALEIARKLEVVATRGEDNESFIDVAHIYDALGQRDTALKFLERAYRARDPWLPREWSMPMISDELRADPRFQNLMRYTGNPWIKFPPPGGSYATLQKKSG